MFRRLPRAIARLAASLQGIASTRLHTGAPPFLGLLAILLATTVSSGHAAGQSTSVAPLSHDDESWSALFDPEPPNGVVESSVQWNGHLVVGGQFTTVGGLTVNGIAEW